MADYDEKVRVGRYRSDTHSVNSDSPTNSKAGGRAKLDCKVLYRRRVVAHTDQLNNISAALQSPIPLEEEADKNTLDIEMPEHTIFGQELKQHFAAVLNQSENGVRVTNIMMDYFSEISEAYINFTKSLGNIAKQKLKSLKAIDKKGDRMESTFDKCCKFLENSSTLAQKYEEFNAKLYDDVVRDFSNFKNVHVAEAKEVSRRAEIMRNGLEEQSKLVKKQKKACVDFLNQTASQKLRKTNMKPSKRKKLSVEEEDKIVQLNLEALDKYKKKCRTANELANLNRFRWWPAMLKRVQLREEKRIDQIRKTLKIFTENEKASHTKFMELSTHREQDLKDSDAPTKNDITGFVEHCHVDMPKNSDTAKRDFIPRFAFNITDDNITLQEDRQNTDSKTQTIPYDDRGALEEPTLMNSTLKNIMSYQGNESVTLSDGTDIPIIVDFLVGALKKIGGKSEGIFRISPDAIRDEVEALRRNFESGHYFLPAEMSPHVVAALLRKWFQRLGEPLFPYDIYDSCMAVAKERKALTTDGGDEEIHDLLAILNDPKMPIINRRVLLCLLSLLSLLSANEKYTMMSVRDLGNCFAPTFFRGPSPNAKLNAIQAMELTNNSLYLFERFVALYNKGIRENSEKKIVLGVSKVVSSQRFEEKIDNGNHVQHLHHHHHHSQQHNEGEREGVREGMGEADISNQEGGQEQVQKENSEENKEGESNPIQPGEENNEDSEL